MTLLNKLKRCWKHLSTTTASGKQAFPPASLKAIEATIEAGEQQHRAEVRWIVESSLSLPLVWQGVSSRQRAIDLFRYYGVWDTEENCGVLVYLNLADHKVEIIADRGINRLVAPSDWQQICRDMSQGFAQGKFNDAALGALSEINALLRGHFPANGERPNQLPNQPITI
ncbi:MAG: TPM domain-containing protein [Pseudomonadota bacterium]